MKISITSSLMRLSSSYQWSVTLAFVESFKHIRILSTGWFTCIFIIKLFTTLTWHGWLIISVILNLFVSNENKCVWTGQLAAAAALKLLWTMCNFRAIFQYHQQQLRNMFNTIKYLRVLTFDITDKTDFIESSTLSYLQSIICLQIIFQLICKTHRREPEEEWRREDWMWEVH